LYRKSKKSTDLQTTVMESNANAAMLNDVSSTRNFICLNPTNNV
jgi:hypothetical protein